MVQLIADYKLHMTTSPMCAFGQVIRDGPGGAEELALKMTTWLSNGEHIIGALKATCSGDHAHASLMGGKAKQAQIYPPALCRAIVQGLRRQLRWSARPKPGQCDTPGGCPLTCGPSVGVGPPGVAQEVPVWQLELLQMEEDEGDQQEPETAAEGEEATDDVHGGSLPPGLVKQAREEEVAYIHNRKIYKYATFEECRRKTGRTSIRLKWIDTNKGGKTAADMRVRSRLVATEVRRKGTERTFRRGTSPGDTQNPHGETHL